MSHHEVVSLQPVTRENVRAFCNLELAEDQRHLVAPAAYTVAEGHYEPGALLRGIHRGERPVGVLLVEVETGTPYLVRFMVGDEHQRSGVGRGAVDLLLDELRAAGWSTLETSHAAGAEGPAGFWRSCGFLRRDACSTASRCSRERSRRSGAGRGAPAARSPP